MSKRARTSKTEKWIKEGRGSGIGADYKPWLHIQDVSLKGRSTRLKGIKTNRQHEFLSDLEQNYFYLTEYSDFVVDIREQFSLLPFFWATSYTQDVTLTAPPHHERMDYSIFS